MERLPRPLPIAEPPETTLVRDVLMVIVRRRRIVLAIYAGVLLTAVAGIFILTPQYRASAKVLITTNRADISTSSERATELVRNGVNQAELNSQIEIIRSRDLIEEALSHLGVEAKEPTPPPVGITGLAWTISNAPKQLARRLYRSMHNLKDIGPSSPLYWQVTDILSRLETNAVKESNVIEVALTSPDPIWARNFVNALTSAYVDRHAQMGGSTQAEDFFTKQSELLRQKLTDSEAALHQLREKAGVLAGQQAEVHQRLNEFNAELSRAKIARAEQEQRVAFLEGVQTRARRSGAVASPQLLELEAKRAELIGRYREDSEKVQDLDKQIRALRTAIAAYDSVASPEEAHASSAATDLTAARAALAAVKGKEEALAHEADQFRKQAELLDAQDFDLVRLERQGKLDEEAYLSYVRSAEEFRLSTALEQSKLLRLRIVELASLPMEPVSPKAGRILFFAIFGGLAASLGAAFVRDHFDTTVKTASDVRRHSNLDVLAVLPDRRGAI
jgi:uncharacterized protein involved in exopolysaccharide biosynthesis